VQHFYKHIENFAGERNGNLVMFATLFVCRKGLFGEFIKHFLIRYDFFMTEEELTAKIAEGDNSVFREWKHLSQILNLTLPRLYHNSL